MKTSGGLFVLDEFRLHAGSADAGAKRVADASSLEAGYPVPLLTSLADPLDCAILRLQTGIGDADAEKQRRLALEPLVADWMPRRRYRQRIAERSSGPVGYYRMAVTEFGDQEVEPAGTRNGPGALKIGVAPTSSPVALLWIGEPLESETGLLVLLGYADQAEVAARGGDSPWPMPLGTDLGVRIYESTCRER